MTRRRDKSEDVGKVLDNAREIPPVQDPAEYLEAAREAFFEGDNPVTPIGSRNDVYFYLDPRGQLRALKDKDHQRLGLLGLFAPKSDIMEVLFPKTTSKGEHRPGQIDFDACARALMDGCSRRPPFEPNEVVRGRGIWAGCDQVGADRLVLHCGETVMVGPAPNTHGEAKRRGEQVRPGEVGAYVYPARPKLPVPKVKDAVDMRQAAGQIMHFLKTWHWARPQIDPVLLLGWIVCAFLSGALDWRPLVWVTGGEGVGKSMLQRLIKGLMGPWLVSSSDPTAAGIWQKLEYDALAVALDEIEAEEHDAKAQRVIHLARQACSGGLVLRGGQSHAGTEFTARSCFLFSSILVPRLQSQDRSRICVLRLKPIEEKNGPRQAPPALEPVRLRHLGQALLMQVVRQWGRFGPVLAEYQTALMKNGHSARAADLYGALLAGADLALNSHADDSAASLEQWPGQIPVDQMAAYSSNSVGCLDHLLGTQIEIGRQRATVGTFLQRAWDSFNMATEDGAWDGGMSEDPQKATKLYQAGLAEFGIRLFCTQDGGLDGTPWWTVAVACRHPGLEQIFKGQIYAGGVWTQSLEMLGGKRSKNVVRFSGVRTHAVLLKLDLAIDTRDREERDDDDDE